MKNNFLGRSLRYIALICAIIVLSYATYSTRLFAHPIAPILSPPPDILWDSQLSGLLGGPGGSVSFDPGTGLLSITGGIIAFAPGTDLNGDDPLFPIMAGGIVSIDAYLTGTTVGTTSIHADFGTAGALAPGFDVTITDFLGDIALAGDLGELSLDGFFGSNTGSGAAIFTPSTGYLLEDFPFGAGMAGPFTLNLDPTWSATSYTDAGGWTGDSKGDIAPTSDPVPEPGTIALLGTGLLGMIGYSRRRFWRKG